MCKTKHSSEDCNRYLFIVSKIDILWSSRRAREFINHYFEQVIEPFSVLNIYFTIFLSVVDCTFYKSTIKSNCILLCHACVRSSRQELFCKNSILRNFAKFTGKRLCLSLFFIKKKKFLRTSFLTENLRWLLLAFQSESTLYSFRNSRSKQGQYVKFK